MKSLQEKIDKIESLWNAGDDYEKQIFEWVKAGVLSLREYKIVQGEVCKWEDLLDKKFGIKRSC